MSAALFGCSVLLTALAPNLYAALAALLVVGYFSISFTTMGNSTLQLSAAPAMRGRVMALWTVAFLGTTPIGGPLIGAIGEHAGARFGLLVGGIAALTAAGYGARGIPRTQHVRADAHVGGQLTEPEEGPDNHRPPADSANAAISACPQAGRD